MSSNGSRRWFQYEGSDGNSYAVDLDENIYEVPALGFGPITAGPTGPVAQGRVISANSTRPLSMRRIRTQRMVANSGTIYKTFYVGTEAALTSLVSAGVLVIGSANWSITSSEGERKVIVPAQDTGTTDGDTDDNFAAGP